MALIAVGVSAVLVAFASGYGYHRDELYFIAAGDHLAWGYADQGPLTPLVARAMTEISADSLTVLRLPSALEDCRVQARIDNDSGIENDEQGEPVMVCAGPRRPWREEWPALLRLG
jgi:hypothetical protein